MKVIKTERGFEVLVHPAYLEPHASYRVVQQSSAIGSYPDSLDRPGSSFLWVGEKHHLDREEVEQLVAHLQAWLKTGNLSQ